MKVDLNEYKTIVQNSLNNILKFLKNEILPQNHSRGL